MKLLGSIVYITSAFYGFGSLLSTLDSLLLCLYLNSCMLIFQDGIVHEKQCKKLEKVSMDKWNSNMICLLCWAVFWLLFLL